MTDNIETTFAALRLAGPSHPALSLTAHLPHSSLASGLTGLTAYKPHGAPQRRDNIETKFAELHLAGPSHLGLIPDSTLAWFAWLLSGSIFVGQSSKPTPLKVLVDPSLPHSIYACQSLKSAPLRIVSDSRAVESASRQNVPLSGWLDTLDIDISSPSRPAFVCGDLLRFFN